MFWAVFMCFSLLVYWVRGGDSPKGLVHNLPMRFFTLDSPIKVSEFYFFDTVIT